MAWPIQFIYLGVRPSQIKPFWNHWTFTLGWYTKTGLNDIRFDVKLKTKCFENVKPF